MKKQDSLLKLIKKLKIEQDALFSNELAIFDIEGLTYEQLKPIIEMFRERRKNISSILENLKKFYIEED